MPQYARAASESRYPSLWRGLIGAWAPGLGNTDNAKIADSTGQGRGGTLTAGAGLPHWQTSEGRWSLQSFSGFYGTSILTLPNISALVSTEATFSFWLSLIEHTPSSGNGAWFWNTADYASHYTWGDGNIYDGTFRAGRVTVGAGNLSDRRAWHLVTISSKPGANGWIFYQNGAACSTQTGDSTITLSSAPTIGASQGGYLLKGKWDDAKLYNRALTAEEVLRLYQAGRCGIYLPLPRRVYLPAAAAQASLIQLPALAAAVSLPAPAIRDAGTVALPALAVSSVLPAPAIRDGSSVACPTVSCLATLPAPALRDATALPLPTIAVSAGPPEPALLDGTLLQLPAIPGAASLGAPTIRDGTLATLPAIACASAPLQPTAVDGTAILPQAVACLASLASPLIQDATAVSLPTTGVGVMLEPTLYDGLQAFWPLNGTLTDLVQALALSSADGLSHYVPGVNGDAWDNNNTAARVPKTTSPGIDTGSAFSVSFWYRFTRTITASDDGAAYAFELRNQSTGRHAEVDLLYSFGDYYIEGIYYQGSLTWESVPSSFFDTNWHHVCFLVNQNGYDELWVDGILRASEPTSTPQAIAPSRFLLGAKTYAAPVSVCDIIESFGWWDRALSDGEVALLYNAGAGWEPPQGRPVAIVDGTLAALPAIAASAALPAPTARDASLVILPVVSASALAPAPALLSSSIIVLPAVGLQAAVWPPTIFDVTHTVIGLAVVTSLASIPALAIRDDSALPLPTLAAAATLPAPAIRDASALSLPALAVSSVLPAPAIRDGSRPALPATALAASPSAPTIQDATTCVLACLPLLASLPAPGALHATALLLPVTSALATIWAPELVVPPSLPGTELSLPHDRSHYALADDRSQFALDDDRMQFELPDQRSHFSLPHDRLHYEVEEEAS